MLSLKRCCRKNILISYPSLYATTKVLGDVHVQTQVTTLTKAFSSIHGPLNKPPSSGVTSELSSSASFNDIISTSSSGSPESDLTFNYDQSQFPISRQSPVHRPARNTSKDHRSNQPRETSWSSPHDTVSRTLFQKNTGHLWSLLEACLDSNNYARAEAVLLQYSKVALPKDLTLAVNNFLSRLVDSNIHDAKVAQKWLDTWTVKLPTFLPDSVSRAIILKNICIAHDFNVAAIQNYLDKYSDSNPANILRHIDALGLDTVSKIVKVCNLPLDVVDKSYRDLIAKTLSPDAPDPSANYSPETDPQTSPNSTEQMILDGSLQSPGKLGVEPLLPVKSVGLKVIQHVVGGLNSDNFVNSVSPLLMDKNIESDNYVDYCELVDQLSPEELKEFELKFEEFNLERQKNLETRGLEGARAKWKDSHEKMKALGFVDVRPLETLLWKWNQQMLPLINEEMKRVKAISDLEPAQNINESSRRTVSKIVSDTARIAASDNIEGLLPDSVDNVTVSDRYYYGPYFTLVDPKQIGMITMMELLKLNSTGGVSEGMRTARAVLDVGKAIEVEYRMSKAAQKEAATFSGVDTKRFRDLKSRKSIISVRGALESGELSGPKVGWPVDIRAKLGSLMISLLLHVAKVPVEAKDPVTGKIVMGEAPAFYHAYQYHGGNRIGVIKVHKYLVKYISGEMKASVIQPQHLPMLVEPLPWTSWRSGGYLYTKSTLMRTKGAPEQLAYLKASSDAKALDSVYEGLNVLGKTAWTINKDVFKVIFQVWNTGKGFLEVPEAVGDLVLPLAPPRSADPSERRDWKRECRLLHNEHQAAYSQRCDANYKLEIARALLGERFYFPHNLDFRGRAYPLSPHLNHLGNDMSRGLLTFWDARELGSSGLKWLKVHTANVFGYDKYSFDERENFIDQNIAQVFDSADKPLDGDKWWQQASDPWQTLAACMELSKALRSTDPLKYKSRLAIHQDGTCNGLQHYAALGGDVEGARQVNLVPGERPADVYTKVVDMVRELVKVDAANGNKLALAVVEKLNRKVIKQTVMTNVYGVTFVGARAQIASQLKDVIDDGQDLYQISSYVAHKVFASVRSLFEGAHLIQDWLGEAARRISRSVRLDIDRPSEKNGNKPDFMSSVIWTTPLGLPIVQPYRQEKKKQIDTCLQSVLIADPYAMKGVNSRKQRTAFPPNYIHSLDASHMLLSAVECGKRNIAFAAVHDSYWTHACDVDSMNEVIRNTFISLHEVDLVSQLKMEMEQRYHDMLLFTDIPRDSELAYKIGQVRQDLASQLHLAKDSGESSNRSKTAAKLSVEDEINFERERIELLRSSDPHDVQRGRQMVTPLSIVEKLSDQELENYITQVIDTSKSNAKMHQLRKSTEHEGTGSDKWDAIEESLDTEPSDDNLSAKLKGSKFSVGIFVPFRVPEVPAKGEFDVRQLKDSKYFFS